MRTDTQFVSDERHAGEDRQAAREGAIELIESVRRAIDAADKYVKNRASDQPLFIDNASNEYLADVAVIKLWVDEFKNSPDMA